MTVTVTVEGPMVVPGTVVPGMVVPGTVVPGLYVPSLVVPGRVVPGTTVEGRVDAGRDDPGRVTTVVEIEVDREVVKLSVVVAGEMLAVAVEVDPGWPFVYVTVTVMVVGPTVVPGIVVPGMVVPVIVVPGIYVPSLVVPGIVVPGITVEEIVDAGRDDPGRVTTEVEVAVEGEAVAVVTTVVSRVLVGLIVVCGTPLVKVTVTVMVDPGIVVPGTVDPGIVVG